MSSTDPRTSKLSNGTNFVETYRSDTYDFVSPRKLNLQGQHVAVISAAKGIGRAIAISFAQAGASKIVLTGRSDLSQLSNELVEIATKAGRPAPQIITAKLDVTSQSSVEAAVAEIGPAVSGHLDAVIVNAGVPGPHLPIVDSDPADWWDTWRAHVFGPYLVSRSFIPLLLASPKPVKTIIQVGSIGALFTQPGSSAYESSKFGLLRLPEFVEAEYGDKGISIYTIHPGGIMTDLGSQMPEAIRTRLNDKVELAGDTVAWLVSEERRWLTSRYVSCNWDMEQFLAKRKEIEDGDLLKVRLAVE